VVKFPAFQENYRKTSRRNRAGSLIDSRVNWLKKITRRLNGANSRSRPSAEQTNLLEQSESVRKSSRSVEVTIETDEAVVYQSTQRQSTKAVPPEKPIQSLARHVDGIDRRVTDSEDGEFLLVRR